MKRLDMTPAAAAFWSSITDERLQFLLIETRDAVLTLGSAELMQPVAEALDEAAFRLEPKRAQFVRCWRCGMRSEWNQDEDCYTCKGIDNAGSGCGIDFPASQAVPL